MRAYPTAVPVLTPAQREAVEHRGGPLLVLGGAGTGKTTVLVERFAWLAERAGRPDAVLALTLDDARRRPPPRARRGPARRCPTRSSSVHDVRRPLRAAAARRGARGRDRPVRRRRSPPPTAWRCCSSASTSCRCAATTCAATLPALLGAIVRRIDALKEELISAADYAAWARLCPPTTTPRARAAREREFAALYLDHDGLLAAKRARSTPATWCCGRSRCCASSRTCARGSPSATATCSSTSSQDRELRPGPAAAAARGRARPDHRVRRRRPGDPPLPRGGDARTSATSGRSGRWRASSASSESLRSPARLLAAAGAVVAPIEDRLEQDARGGAGGGEIAFWRCAYERAQAQAVAAEVERLIRAPTCAPERHRACWCARVRDEGQAVAVAFEERAVPYRTVGRGGVLRSAPRSATCWPGCGCWSTRATRAPSSARSARPPIELRAVDLARCMQIARRRKLDMVVALVAATESPQLPPEARERIVGFLKLHRPRPRRSTPRGRTSSCTGWSSGSGCGASSCSPPRPTSSSGCATSPGSRELAGAYVRRAPQATAREFARSIAAVADAGLREDEAADADRRARRARAGDATPPRATSSTTSSSSA